MILETEEESRDFVTTYEKDYYLRTTKRPTAYKPVPDFPSPLNILNGPYKEYLYTRKKNVLLPLDERYEESETYLNKTRIKYPHLKGSLPETSPNENVIEEEEKKLSRTVYELDFAKDFERHLTRDKIGTLPEDWIIPETIQRQSFRDPWKIATEELLRVRRVGKPTNNLNPNIKERKILRVTTGDSEYAAAIGVTGSRIIQELPSILSTIPEDIKENSKYECSYSESRNIALPSRIF